MIYFIVDWFSFNVLVEIGKRESFRRLFLSISFLVFLGYIIVLTETQLYANTYIFLWFLLIYFLGTIMSYFFGLVFGIAGKNDVIFRIAVKKEGMWVKIDWFVKLFLCIAGTIYLMFFKLNTDTAIVALIGILLLLIVIKCIRLTHLVKKGTHE
jgi:hypothetical protein